MHATASLIALSALVARGAAHGFISAVTVDGQTTKAQKTDIKQSIFRAVSDNTGWIGSNFLSSDCAVCGCSNTPFGQVAAPGGTVFSTAGQSAGKTGNVKAGDTVTLHVSGNPGEGWPHPNGHMQAYMADCGGSCTNVDAKNLDFFKIQGIKNGIPALRAAFDKGSDSNPWDIQIPSGVKNGNYIMRAEIWAYGQSSQAEGNQVQFYSFCSSLAVTNGGNANPPTVNFPGEYANQKDQIVAQQLNLLPGPEIDASLGGSGTGGSSNKGGSTAENSTGNVSTGSTGSDSSNNAGSPSSPPPSSNNSSSSSSSNNNGGGKKKSGKKTGKKCGAPKAKQQRRRSSSHHQHAHAAHRRHHAERAGHRHAS